MEAIQRRGQSNRDQLDAKIRESLSMSKEMRIKRKGGGQVIVLEGQQNN